MVGKDHLKNGRQRERRVRGRGEVGGGGEAWDIHGEVCMTNEPRVALDGAEKSTLPCVCLSCLSCLMIRGLALDLLVGRACCYL